MTFLDLARKRFSARKYKELPVEEEKIREMLEAGRVAPTAANYQPLRFIVITDPELLQKVSAAYRRDWFAKASAIIIICGDHSRA